MSMLLHCLQAYDSKPLLHHYGLIDAMLLVLSQPHTRQAC